MSDQSKSELKSVQVAVAAIWRNVSGTVQVLISRRPPGTHLAGFWEFPGGKVEPGESPADAAARETREEVGVDIAGMEPLAVVQHRYEDRLVTLHAFTACAPAEASPRALHVADVRWIPLAELNQYDFPAANEAILSALKQRLVGLPVDDQKSSRLFSAPDRG